MKGRDLENKVACSVSVASAGADTNTTSGSLHVCVLS